MKKCKLIDYEMPDGEVRQAVIEIEPDQGVEPMPGQLDIFGHEVQSPAPVARARQQRLF